MAKRIIPKDTTSFHYYQLNPSNISTGDCVIRTLGTAFDMTWEEVFDELSIICKKYHYSMGDDKAYSRLLKAHGCVLNGCPKKEDNSKYTGREFCKDLAYPGVRYIAHIGANHMVCIKDNKIWDTWDSSEGCIGKVWTVPIKV